MVSRRQLQRLCTRHYARYLPLSHLSGELASFQGGNLDARVKFKLVQNLPDMALAAWRCCTAYHAAARRLDVLRPVEFHPQPLFLVEIIETAVSGSALLASISRGLGAWKFLHPATTWTAPCLHS